MPPGLKKKIPSSNTTGTLHRTTAVRVDTASTTPAPQIVPSTTPSSDPSPSSRTSVVVAPESSRRKRRTVALEGPESSRRKRRGPTRGKGVVAYIAAHNEDRLPVYVTPIMRAFCGKNATRVATFQGKQIRTSCPTENCFYHTWKRVPLGLKEAIFQGVRDKFRVTEKESVLGDDIEDGNEHTELIEDVFNRKASRLYKDWKFYMGDHYWKMEEKKKDDPRVDPYKHNAWMDGSFSLIIYSKIQTLRSAKKLAKKIERMYLQSGTPMTGEDLSRNVLGERRNYLRGFGVGPMPSSYSFKSSFNSAHQGQLQKIQSDMELFREEQQREREKMQSEREEEQRRQGEIEQRLQREREEMQREREEEQRRREESELRLQREREEMQREREEEQRRWEENEKRLQREREEIQRERDEEQMRRDENERRLQRELDELKTLVRQQMQGQGNLGSG